MVDIHTHLLPGVDDGSLDMDNSLLFVKKMQEAGVSDCFVTPHYIIGEYDNTPEVVAEKHENLTKAITAEGYEVNVHKGVEVYLSSDIHNKIDLRHYCLGSSDYILVESAMNGFPANILEIFYHLVKKGFKPIFAHPERYIDVIKKVSLVEDLIYRNVYMQVNAGSFLGIYGEQVAKTAWDLFHKGFIHFIASDCHCHRDEYLLPVAKQLLKERYPEYASELFFDTNPRKIIENEVVEYFNPAVHQVIEEQDTLLNRIKKLFL